MLEIDFSPIQQVRVPREIANRIATMILEGRIEPGSRLPPERVLATKFQVSRPTIREAIHVLEAHRLVEIRSGGGTYVARKPSALSSHLLEQMLQRDDGLMIEMADVRKDFEARNAELAAIHATAADIQNLTETLTEMEAETAQGQDRYDLDVDFHLTIAEATHNRVRAFITTSLLVAHFDMLQEARRRMIRHQRQLLGDFLREHRAIHRAIQARDPEASRRAMIVHLEAVRTHYAELLPET